MNNTIAFITELPGKVTSLRICSEFYPKKTALNMPFWVIHTDLWEMYLEKQDLTSCKLVNESTLTLPRTLHNYANTTLHTGYG